MSQNVVEAPLVLAEPEAANWANEADVIVVGLGAAGGSAAIEARDRGADVLVVDRFEGGGATRWSGGIYYAGGTRHQREAGKDDNAGEMLRYLAQEVGDVVRPETLQRFCEGSKADLEWLERQGIGFSGKLHEAKTTFPDEDKFLFYSGNEKVPAFAAHAKPAPRGHRAVGKGWSGYVIAGRLKESAAQGTRQMFHARVLRLVQDPAGGVIGVEVLRIPRQHHAAHQACYDKMDPIRPFGAARSRRLIARAREIEERRGERVLLRARTGVVLAAGGFAYNADMVRQYLPHVARDYDKLIRMAALSCDGSGILLGQSVGAATARMDNPFLGRMMTPPNASVQGLMVNARGERFINEDAYVGMLGAAIAEQPEGKAWLVVDDAVFRRIRSQALDFKSGNFRNFGLPMMLNILFGGTKKARTLSALAAKIGVPADALERAIADNNEAVRSGAPDPQGRIGENCVELGSGPYRAIDNAPHNVFSFMPFFSLGGLRVDEDTGAVLNEAGLPVSGLFAAGRTAVGLCSNGYQSGMSIADCVFSGRRAGASVARANL